MKRLWVFFFVLLLLSGCAACGEDEDALVRVTYWGDYNGEYEIVKLSEEKERALLTFLEGLDTESWINDANNCAKDYKFETQTRHWEYSVGCGALSDYTHHRCIDLSQEQADTLHGILGIPHTTASAGD